MHLKIYPFCFRRIADAVRTKIEKFKVHLFVLGQTSFIYVRYVIYLVRRGQDKSKMQGCIKMGPNG